MIVHIHNKPSCFNHLEQAGYQYYMSATEAEDICCFAILKQHEEAMIHLEMLGKFTKSNYEIMSQDFHFVLDLCEKMQCKRLVAINKEYEDPKWPKFIKLFGFPEPTVLAVSAREV